MHAVTAAPPCVQVLLVMLRGKKRFRVAGQALGSSIAIDHVLRPGDAIYIPAGCFHSGAARYKRRTASSSPSPGPSPSRGPVRPRRLRRRVGRIDTTQPRAAACRCRRGGRSDRRRQPMERGAAAWSKRPRPAVPEFGTSWRLWQLWAARLTPMGGVDKASRGREATASDARVPPP